MGYLGNPTLPDGRLLRGDPDVATRALVNGGERPGLL